MKKFQQNVSRELKRAYPDRRKLEMQCITAIAFAKNDFELLNCPCWVELSHYYSSLNNSSKKK